MLTPNDIDWLERPEPPLIEDRTQQARFLIAKADLYDEPVDLRDIRRNDAAVFRELVPHLIELFGEERVASELKITLQRLRGCLDWPLPHHDPPEPDVPPWDWRYRLGDLWTELAGLFTRILTQTQPTPDTE